MNSPQQLHEVRLRGLGGPAVCGIPGTGPSATGVRRIAASGIDRSEARRRPWSAPVSRVSGTLRGEGRLPQGLAPEAELLLCCALARPDAARMARAGEILDGALDWGRVARYALRHRLAPLLHVHLDAIGGGRVPAEVAEALRAHHAANARRNLRLAGELHLILRAFADAGILAAALKGPWLAAQADGSLNLRTFRDLDLLVLPADTGRAGEVMQARGYRLHRPSWDGGKDALFVHPADGTVVEVHHDLGSAALPVPYALGALGDRLERVPVLGVAVPGLPLEENLLFLAHHGAAHGWSRLAWLTGFAQVMRARGGELDAIRLHARAVELGVGRMLRLALRLSDALLGVPLPPALADAVHRDARATRLARRACADLFRESEPAAGGSASAEDSDAEACALLSAATAWLEGGAADGALARARLREPASTFGRRARFALGAGDRARDGARFLAEVAPLSVPRPAPRAHRVHLRAHPAGAARLSAFFNRAVILPDLIRRLTKPRKGV
jgi:hypothetical protein